MTNLFANIIGPTARGSEIYDASSIIQ